jgi:SAM-dependent methyltransferase
VSRDLFGQAILDFYNGKNKTMLTETSWSDPEELPIEYLFRSYDEMPKLEQRALKMARGKILDIGAGAGSHSLYLQESGLDVMALDVSEPAIQACKLRGVRQCVKGDIFTFGGKFDTLLLLMNGTGLSGTLDKLSDLLRKLKELISSGGQILIDSSDLIYLFDSDSDDGVWIPGNRYYGEVDFTMHYNGQSETIPWLYVSYDVLEICANQTGLKCEKIMDGDHYDYLARLTSA